MQRHRFNVEYRAGKANELADALSRLPLPEDHPMEPLTDFYGDAGEREALLVQLTESCEGSGLRSSDIPTWLALRPEPLSSL